MRSNKHANRAMFLASLFLWSSLASCRGTPRPPVHPAGGSAAAPAAAARVDQVLVALEDAPDGLALRLSHGKAGSARDADRPRLVPAARLSEPDAARLLDRMPPLLAEGTDRVDFALREKSQPPPRTGDTIKGVFPPPPTKAPRPGATVAGTELKVVRFAPEGEVPVAPHLAITFNQPMVAITSHADSVAQSVPVTLTPQPKGQWRWLGSKTLMFDPDVRFPAATEYKVEIPAGTKSASGAVLRKAVSFRFATPALEVLTMWPSPHEPQRRDPLAFVSFDQRVDAAAALTHISFRAGSDVIAARLATPEEIEKDATVKELVAQEEAAEHAGRFIAFKPVSLLPGDSRVEVRIAGDTPSAEGPRVNKSATTYGFHTFGPLKVEIWRCSWGPDCRPGASFSIKLSNPIDVDRLDPDAFKIEPALPGLKVVPSGMWLEIAGRQRGRTTYKVTLPASLRDTFDQTLGKPQTLEFHVGDATPQLFGPSGLTLLDPSAKRRTYDLHTINVKSLDVAVYQVTPDDWPRFARYMQKNPRKPVSPPGRRVVNKTIKIAGSPDEMVETQIDLAAALAKSGHGHAVVHVEPTRWPDRWKPELDVWVQSTDIALDAFVDSQHLLAWATRLADGAPAGGVELSLAPKGARGTTSARGTAELALPASDTAAQLLLASAGDDRAFLPQNLYWWSDYGGWEKHDRGETVRWFVYDDRGMYRPGEKVSLKGWLRTVDLGEGGDVSAKPARLDEVSFVVSSAQGNEIAKGTAEVNPLGGFDARFDLPKTPNLGTATVSLRARGATHRHTFQIQEFRRPEYEVSATASEGPHLVGGAADVTVKAQYYAGGGLANADVVWNVRSEPADFAPPGRSDFAFGIWEPWWTRHRRGYQDESKTDRLEGKTDAIGQHILHLDFLSIKPPRPMSVVAEAYVMDVNRQQWAASSALLVHPSALYVGLKQERYFVDQGVPIEVQAIAVDHDGKAAVGAAIDMKAVRLDWSYRKGEWKQEEADPQGCAVVAAEGARKCTFATPEGGTYRITATVTDAAGRPNQTQILVWVSGGDVPPERNVAQQEVTIIPDAKEYRPGQTAKLLVQAPFFPAHGLLTLRRSGIVETRAFELKGPTATLEVPVTEGHVPNVFAQVDLVGSAPRVDDDGRPDDKLPRRPAYGVGVIELPVPPVTRRLAVSVKPRATKLEPRGSTRLDLVVRNPLGRPVSGAELSVVVVDEAVLALSRYATPDPLAAFYPQRDAGASDYHGRQYVTLARPDLASLAAASGGEGGVVGGVLDGDGRSDKFADAAPMASERESRATTGKAEAPRKAARADYKELKKNKSSDLDANEASAVPQGPIAVRKDFGALAVFAPEIKTDAGGAASVFVKLPDNLTRYRVMVAAVAGEKQFGSGEANITARMPLMVRPSLPRFLNFGDRFEVPVVLQNQTDRAMSVDVGVRATNAALTEGHGRRVTVPANDRVEVRFPAAAEMAGTARFQLAATSGRFADAAEVALPVWTPATSEAFAVYGEIDKGAVRQKVAMPRDVVTQFGGLEITTSSTQLQALTDAFVYLVAYPYECAEQVSSRVLAIAALRDVLHAFKAEGLPGPAAIERAVERDLEKLKGLQNWDGGFAFWERGHESWPYISIHVGHALVRAQEKKVDVPAGMIERNKKYLRDIDSHLPWYYSPEVKRSLRSYALYVRKRMGDNDIGRARSIIKEAGGVDKLPMEAVGWLLYVMSGDAKSAGVRAEMHRVLDNRATETAATAHWATGYKDGGHLILESDRRADGIILEALIEDRPSSDLIAKVVRGLLAHRTRGRWSNTQDNAFVLLAMDRYFHVFEKVTPDFVSRAWLGDAFAGEHPFKGRQTDYHQIDVPMSYLADQAKKGSAAQDLVLQKDGAGRLYYRVGMTYAPKSLWLEPADQGFAVERTYEAVDDPTDVVRQKDGSWKIKAGASVRVRLTMVAEARRYHVALVDPLPAGLEPVNPALAVSGTVPQDPKAQKEDPWWYWTRTWYEHQNMRDERVEAFTSLLWEGVHEYTYVARATTPGNFVVPPTRAEEMYMPETFGRSASDRVVVE
ncbi:MAG TPA: alpha-2-macroglobulin family protein [Kofleriaceae bacterium]|nr:alpha-2-macroglobulin family protein [Kofleriaceae bacterium]